MDHFGLDFRDECHGPQMGFSNYLHVSPITQYARSGIDSIVYTSVSL